MDLKPEILTHPNIPKPLHGINPRTILGKEWWDKTRFEAQKKTGYRCAACGVHKSEAKGKKWLECHEFWDINYENGICKVKSIEPLCHYCHNFIHSGRLAMIINKEKSAEEVISILEHGFLILSSNNLKVFPPTLKFANSIGVFTWGVEPYNIKINKALKWSDYKMVLNGVEYSSKFNSVKEWLSYYK